MLIRPALALSLALPSALMAASEPAKDVTPTPVVTTLADVVERVRPAVVMVSSSLLSPRPVADLLRDAGQTTEDLGDPEMHQDYWLRQPWLVPISDGFGSGIIVDARGLVLTNAHLVENFNQFFVTLLDGAEFPANCIGFDSQSDVALLEISNPEGRQFPTITMGDSSAMRVGDQVMTMGTPLEQELAQSVSTGIVSALGRSVDLTEYENFIQTDCAINPGNSGGPLLNANGEAVGITTAIASLTGTYSGIGFAVPIDHARIVADQILRNGRMRRAYLGVNLANVNPAIAEALRAGDVQGALIAGIRPDSPASRAGFLPYDIITAVDGIAVWDADDLRERVSSHEAGTNVMFRVIRAGQSTEVNVLLSELTADVLGIGKGSTVLPEAPPPVPADSFGIEVEDLTAEVAQRIGLDLKHHPLETGVVVTTTVPGSYAAHRLLLPGTRVVEVNQTPVTTAADFRDVVARAEGNLILLRVEKVTGGSEIVALHRGQ